jgi:hypothetical protein
MILSSRERFTIVGTAVVVPLLIVVSYVVPPLLDYRDAIAAQKQSLVTQMERAQGLLARKRQVAPKWKEMTAAGLKHDPGEAEGQVLRSVRDWSEESGLKVISLKPERLPDKKILREISFQAIGTGSMNAVARFLWKLENAKVPIRVKELQLGSRKEGTDDLTLQLRLSTLYESPEPPAPGAAGASAPVTGGRG